MAVIGVCGVVGGPAVGALTGGAVTGFCQRGEYEKDIL